MIEMTPAAHERLEDYFGRLRSELHGTRAEVAEEVEQSVREHIEIALADAKTPVSETDIIGILDRLGAPEQWVGDEEAPIWHPTPAPPVSGQMNSRLPYVSFGLVIASIVLLPMFGFFLLIPAMFVSRAWIDQTRDRGEPLGARRWLVYPAIALVLALGAFFLLVVPPALAMTVTRDEDFMQMFDLTAGPGGELRLQLALRGLAFGSWWILVAGLCATFLRPIRFLFAPLLDGLRRKHFVVLAAIGALIAAAGAVLINYRP